MAVDSYDAHEYSIRLNAQHFLWTRQLRFHIHPDIVLPRTEELKVADVGTGTG